VSPLARIQRRLGDESGFSLMELLVAATVGMVVLLATFNLMDASTKASAAVEDRVEALQRGRTAYEQIVQRLRSQVCPDTNTPAISYGGDSQVDFNTEIDPIGAAASDDVFDPERRSIRLQTETVGTESRVRLNEYVWNNYASTGTHDRKTALIDYTGNALEDEPAAANGEGRAVGAPVPIFRYYAFLGNDPATPALLLETPLSATDMARVVKIAISFDARPGRRRATKNRTDTTFEGDVYVRTADPTDPEHSPQCL
jgi:Tfp pilus assembly protein FimT